MKKILFIVFCLATIVACKNEKATGELSNIVQNDSLQKIIAQRDQEINDMVGMLNDVEEGFRAINKAEERVTILLLIKLGPKANSKFINSHTGELGSDKMAKLMHSN